MYRAGSLLRGLVVFGMTPSAANTTARALAPFQALTAQRETDGLPSWMREVEGPDGALLVAQLKAAGIRYLFVAPGEGAGPVYDALVE